MTSPFINSYIPPAPSTSTVLSNSFAEPYDINFCIPLPDNPTSPTYPLQTNLIRLIPFIPSVHGRAFYSFIQPVQAEVTRYLPFEFSTYDSFLEFLEGWARAEPAAVMFAIMPTRPTEVGAEANAETETGAVEPLGIVALLKTMPKHKVTEIGSIIIHPKWQRTHVTTHTVGILLKWLLNSPHDPSSPGIGYRRVTWSAGTQNEKSIKAAERLGFKKEGVLRWSFVMPQGRGGKKLEGWRKEIDKENDGRDSAILSVCWDDWENGGREHIEKLLTRKE